eukprot:TRINITY_DN54_c0_g2_i1.p1 TRINITY_DN54_c0_g2~~TRINITY_DN54_c0_g2_i1.p1  ORF type:complete len:694 (+),score=162.95 TRINITY_DN54_c0_g2_i1:38-2119(+)
MLGLFNSSGESLRRQLTQQTRVQLGKVTSALFSRFYSVSAKAVNSSTLWLSDSAPRYWTLFGSSIQKREDAVRKQLEKYYITKIVWSPKQYGCYLHFLNPKEAQMASRVLNQGKKKTSTAFVVEGNPFTEDLVDRRPTLMLQLKLKGPMLTDEEIFSQFRRFGKMRDLTIDEKAATAKVVFDSIHSANAAMNCMHLKKIGETMLEVSYAPYARFKIPWDVIASPRLIVPIAGATITTITLLIDTIRLYFVTQKLTLESAVDFVGEQAASGGTWATHKVTTKEEELKKILDAPPSNVLLVVGPKGTDKSSLFKKLLARRMFSVRIDCSQVDTVQEFMDLVVHDIGFRPSFTTINTLLSWFSSIVPGAGQASVESQFRSVLRALERTYLLARAPPVIAFDEIEHFLRLLDSDNKDEVRKATAILKLLSSWSARLAQSGTAHIVFISNSTFSEAALRKFDAFKTLPVVHMSDISKEEAKGYMQLQTKQHLPKPIRDTLTDTKVNEIVDLVGGRPADLDYMLWLMKNGRAPTEAMDQMLEDAKKVVRRKGFGGELFGKVVKTPWTQSHLWKTMRLLQKQDNVPYDSLLVSVFEGNEVALQALIEQNLLSIAILDGKKTVSAHSPLYLAAFRNIMSREKEFSTGMDKFVKEAEITKELGKIEVLENELVRLGRYMYNESKLGLESKGRETKKLMVKTM